MAATKDSTNSVSIKDIADKLGIEPRELRKFVRGLDLGVGRGTRYAWPSMADTTVKRVIREWNKAHAPAQED